MDSPPKTLKATLQTIRDLASNALEQIEQPQEARSMRWVCKGCRYVKHFTKPVVLETASGCPRCKSTAFNPILWDGCHASARSFLHGTPVRRPGASKTFQPQPCGLDFNQHHRAAPPGWLPKSV